VTDALGVGVGGILTWGIEDPQSSVVFQLESCECDGGTVGDRGMGCVFRVATSFDGSCSKAIVGVGDVVTFSEADGTVVSPVSKPPYKQGYSSFSSVKVTTYPNHLRQR